MTRSRKTDAATRHREGKGKKGKHDGPDDQFQKLGKRHKRFTKPSRTPKD